MDGVSFETAEKAVKEIIEDVKRVPIPDEEIEKVRNKFESLMLFSNTSVLNKAMNLGFYELLGDANGINNELKLFYGVSSEMVLNAANKYLNDTNCSTLLYKSMKSGK
jgi:predicted Zn-dependent peptidase